MGEDLLKTQSKKAVKYVFILNSLTSSKRPCCVGFLWTFLWYFFAKNHINMVQISANVKNGLEALLIYMDEMTFVGKQIFFLCFLDRFHLVSKWFLSREKILIFHEDMYPNEDTIPYVDVFYMKVWIAFLNFSSKCHF